MKKLIFKPLKTSTDRPNGLKHTASIYLYLIRYAVLKKYYVITLAIRLHIGFKMMILAKLYSLEVSLLLVIALNPEGLSPSFILNLN